MTNLNKSQLRSIKALVRVAESKIMDMEASVGYFMRHSNEADSPYANDMTEDECHLFLAKIDAMHQLLHQIKSTYHVDTPQRMLKKELYTKSAFLWEEISGATFNRMAGYGTLDEAERNTYENLQQHLKRLAEDMIALSKPS